MPDIHIGTLKEKRLGVCSDTSLCSGIMNAKVQWGTKKYTITCQMQTFTNHQKGLRFQRRTVVDIRQHPLCLIRSGKAFVPLSGVAISITAPRCTVHGCWISLTERLMRDTASYREFQVFTSQGDLANIWVVPERSK